MCTYIYVNIDHKFKQISFYVIDHSSGNSFWEGGGCNMTHLLRRISAFPLMRRQLSTLNSDEIVLFTSWPCRMASWSHGWRSPSSLQDSPPPLVGKSSRQLKLLLPLGSPSSCGPCWPHGLAPQLSFLHCKLWADFHFGTFKPQK